MSEKKILDDWTEHVKVIMESTGVEDDETEEQQAARRQALEADPEQWFSYYFPRYASCPPAPFHLAAAKRVIERPEHYEVRMWSRELAKSTRTMMEVMYLALVGHPPRQTPAAAGSTPPAQRLKKKCVLLISNSLDNATRLLMPYRANLEYNRRLINDYGRQETTGRWQAAEFITQSGVAFRALGAGQSPRGTRNEEIRPDVLIFDDVDTDADCLNPQTIAQKWRWIEEAAIGTRSVSQPTTIIFCGNRIAADCCIVRAAKFADSCDTINIRGNDGLSVWPQKNTEAAIDRVLAQKSYAAMQKEYFNNPVTEGAVFGQMHYKPALPLPAYECLVCYTDPSYKDTCDFKATVLVGYVQGEFHIIKCFLEQTTTAAMLHWHRQLRSMVSGCNCYFYMEDVFMQDVLIRELNDAFKKEGTSMRITGDKRAKPPKFARIETLLEPLNRSGSLFLNIFEQDNPHMQRLEEQFRTFAPGSSAHDDGPDAVEGAVWKITGKMALQQPGSIVTVPKEAKRLNRF